VCMRMNLRAAVPILAVHKPVKHREEQTWDEICNESIEAPFSPRRPCAVISAAEVADTPQKTALSYVETDGEIVTLPSLINDTKPKFTIVKRYKPILDPVTGQDARLDVAFSRPRVPAANLSSNTKFNPTLKVSSWSSSKRFFRGLVSRNWHRSERSDPVGPTMRQNPITGSFTEIDIEGHLEIHCPVEKELFNEKFVVKILLPGGNLRKCYVKFHWDNMTINFYRHKITRYYPFKYLQEANDSPGILTHMMLTGATSDLVEIDKKSFCSLYLSNVSHPLLLVFGNSRRKEYFVRLVQHIIEFCKSEDYFYDSSRVIGKKKNN